VGMLGFWESLFSQNEDESSNKPSGWRREGEREVVYGIVFFQLEWWYCLWSKTEGFEG